MRREIVAARSGEPTLLIDGVSVHSRYDPRREAVRYVESLGTRVHDAAVVIVIGEGLPYLHETLQRRLPRTSVLSIRVGPIGPDPEEHAIDLLETPPGSVRRWLRERIPPLNAGSIEIITWEPARAAITDRFRAGEEEVLQTVRDLHAQIATTGSFGRRWITNAIRSAIAADVRWNVSPRRDVSSPDGVSILTSGPGIELFLAKHAANDAPGRPASRTSPFPGIVMATSSVLTTLRNAGIDPDLVIHTDGGFWAKRYLREATPSAASDPLVVALPARAAIPYRRLNGDGPEGIAPLFLATGWIGDELHEDHAEWPRVTESPTVTGTLLSFAREVAPGEPLYVAGLDLCSRGLLGHARPHLNDRFMATSARRLNSEATQRARRIMTGEVRTVRWSDGVIGWQSDALETFESVIASLLADADATGRILPLYPRGVHPPVWTPFIEKGDDPVGAFGHRTTGRSRTFEKVSRSSRRDRTRHVRATLGRWKEAVSADGWDERTRDLAFHLAPVEVLREQKLISPAGDLNGDRDGVPAAASARGAAMEQLDALAGMVERLHG